jgi:hypothetical protein
MIFCSAFISRWATCSIFKILNALSDKARKGAMQKIVSLLVLLLILFGVVGADARGGRGEDCPPKSTDPDCK